MEGWKQYQGNESNQGFLAAQTTVATKPCWVIEIGKVAHASPVIGQDGTVYVATLAGELVAVNPDGTIKWKHMVTTKGNPDYPGIITGSPAIASDGNIYVITTLDAIIENRRTGVLKSIHVRRSSLHSFTPAGNRRWSYRFPTAHTAGGLGAYALSSPKVWGQQNIFIFVPALSVSGSRALELLVINQFGNLVSKLEVSSTSTPVSANGRGTNEASYSSIWDYLKKPDELANLLKGDTVGTIMDWPEPTLAIADFASHEQQPVILIENNVNALLALRWNFPVLMPIWSASRDQQGMRTSPAVFANNKIFSGGQDGSLVCYNLDNGSEACKPWRQSHYAIIGPPVCLDNHIYFISGDQVIVMDSNMNIKNQYQLTGKSLGPLVLSANHLYLAASDGFYTFSSDLSVVGKNADFSGGVSSPAISQDGRVYALDLAGKLWAFGE